MLHLVLRPRSQTKYELEDQIIKFFASCHFASFCHHLIPVFYIKGNACLCIFVLSVTGKCCCCSPACWDLICSKSLLSANSSNGSLFLWPPQIHLRGPEEYLYLPLWRRPATLTRQECNGPAPKHPTHNKACFRMGGQCLNATEKR